MNKLLMMTAINELMWEDIDGFFSKSPAKSHFHRTQKVVVVGEFPFDALPGDN